MQGKQKKRLRSEVDKPEIKKETEVKSKSSEKKSPRVKVATEDLIEKREAGEKMKKSETR